MEGEEGRRWQVRGILFLIIVDIKKSRYSPLERGINLNLFHLLFYRHYGRVWRGEWGLSFIKRVGRRWSVRDGKFQLNC